MYPDELECVRCGGAAERRAWARDRPIARAAAYYRCVGCGGGGSIHPSGVELGPVFTGKPPIRRVASEP